jgi:CBS domain-containing protein
MKVRDIMHRGVVTVRADAPLKEVARLLVEHAISGLPVVDEAGAVIGVVSETDLVIKERGRPERPPRLIERLFGPRAADRAELAKVEATAAGDAMSSPAITIDAGRPVRDAAELMIERRINRLPVTDGGRLVGIVTRADIVRSFIRPDEEIRRSIVEDVIERAMWLDARLLTVSVRQGVVRLEGTIDRRSSVAILEALVHGVGGVVAVETDLRWQVDDSRYVAPEPDLVSPPYGPR